MASTMVRVLGQFFDQLASFARLIRLDKRGVGMSDPMLAGGAPPLEQQVGDVLAVMDAVGSGRAALYGGGASGPVALFVRGHASRSGQLDSSSTTLSRRYFVADDYPWGAPVDTRERLLEQVRERWGDLDHPWGLHTFAPSRAPESDYAREFGRVQQVCASKSAAVAEYRVFHDSDLRDVLPLVQAPTLITFPEALPFLNDAGRYLADHIADARVAHSTRRRHLPDPRPLPDGWARRWKNSSPAYARPSQPTACWPRCSLPTSSPRPSASLSSATACGVTFSTGTGLLYATSCAASRPRDQYPR